MIPAIKAIEIVESPGLSPDSFTPDDKADFVCTFGLTIGPAGSDGGELFYITVCSPTRLEQLCERDGFVWGRHRLIVPYFDFDKIRSIMTKFVSNCGGETWQEIAPKIARLGAWEFEDYIAL